MDRNTGVKEHQKEQQSPSLVAEFDIMLNLEKCILYQTRGILLTYNGVRQTLINQRVGKIKYKGLD